MNLDHEDGRLEDVWLGTLFPLLPYNDILRLRRVCKYIKKLATAYLWMTGNQGNWELEINPLLPGHSLNEFLAIEPPPFSRLKVNYRDTTEEDQSLLFENEMFWEFLEKYGNYVTHLWIRIEIPFIHKRELDFYESLKNLQHLHCYNVTFKSVDDNTKNEDIFVIPSTFKNLKTFIVEETDNVKQMWNFIDKIESKLNYLKYPFYESIYNFDDLSDDDSDDNDEENTLPLVNFEGLQRIIEHRSNINVCSNLLILDWEYGLGPFANKLDFLRVCAKCFENGIRIKNMRAEILEYLLCDETGRINKEEEIDPVTGELVWRINYTCNLFIGNIIQSLIQLRENVFLMELPILEELLIKSTSYCKFRIWQRHGYPQWPNLKILKVHFDGERQEMDDALINFLFGRIPRSNLEEIMLDYSSRHNYAQELPLPRNFAILCSNLKKITISHCIEQDDFFVSLWEGLPLLEYVSLGSCYNLCDLGFIGNANDEENPIFLQLKRLKTLCIVGLQNMPKFTDRVFIIVFRHMKLTALTLSSRNILPANIKVTVKGIEALLNGSFAETVEKLHLENLILPGVSHNEIKRLTSLFRSSKML